MDENWKNLEDAEDFACFRAELVEMSPESYSVTYNFMRTLTAE